MFPRACNRGLASYTLSSVYRLRYLPLYTVCDIKNVVTLRPFTSRDHNTVWDRNPSCLSVCLSICQTARAGWGAVSSCSRVIDAALSLPPSPSFIHSHVSHHRGFRRKRDDAVRVCVCRRLGRLALPLPLFLLRPVVDVAGGQKEGQNLARLRVTRLCCLRGAREATWMEGGSGMGICYRRHHRQDRKTNREVN